jgi:hypothetical protein
MAEGGPRNVQCTQHGHVSPRAILVQSAAKRAKVTLCAALRGGLGVEVRAIGAERAAPEERGR